MEIFKFAVGTKKVPLAEEKYYVVEEKKLENNVGVIEACIEGECNSKLLSFELPRYYDRVDLSKKTPYITFKTPDGSVYKNKCVNFKYSDTKIRMSWLLGKEVCTTKGLVECSIALVGKNSYGGSYALRTTIFSINVLPSIFEECENVVEVDY